MSFALGPNSRAVRWRLVEGMFLGSAAALIVGFVLLRLGGLNPWILGWGLLAVSAGSLVVARRERAEIPRMSQRDWQWFAGAGVVGLVGLWSRQRPVYFLFQYTDFGEYVNRANLVAEGGSDGVWFLPGFTIGLAETNLLLGESRSVSLLPFLGVMVLVGVAATARRLGASVTAVAATSLILSVHVIPSWFAQLPTSEGLFAVLLLGFILTTHTAIGSQLYTPVPAIFVFLLTITRVDAYGFPVLLAVLLIGACGLATETRRATASVATWSLVSWWAAMVWIFRSRYEYGIEYSVSSISDFPSVEVLDRLRSIPSLGIMTLAVGGVALALGPATRRWGHKAAGLGSAVGLSTAVAGAIAVLYIGSNGLREALGRYGFLPGLIIGIGLCVLLVGAVRPTPHRPTIALLLGLGSMFAVLYAFRFPEPKFHAVFLYYDRYLFSVLFPVAAIAMALGLSFIGERVEMLSRDRSWIPRLATCAIAAVAGTQAFQSGAILRERGFHAEAYERLEAVAALVPEGTPLLWSGIPPEILVAQWGFFFDNSFRIFALPLEQTFNLTVANGPSDPFGPDPVPTTEEILETASQSQSGSVAVAQFRPEQAPVGEPPVVGAVLLGSRNLQTSRLVRTIGNTPTEWQTFRYAVDIFLVQSS